MDSRTGTDSDSGTGTGPSADTGTDTGTGAVTARGATPGRGTGARVLGGRYHLVEVVGRGGMGAVWAAQDEVLGRAVAVKEVTPSPGLAGEERAELRERTLREGRAAARISSPHAITVYDVVEADDRLWIVLELLPSRTLADAIAELGPLPASAAARVGLDVLDALRAAHAVGVLHRDVKPSNVLLTDDGHAVLTDFGIAALDGEPGLTGTGILVGSPAYLSPERARGDRPTAASDLWALGALLYTAVEGHAPFDDDDPVSILAAVVAGPAPIATRGGPLAVVIDRLLACDPVDRPSAEEARDLLLAAIVRMHGRHAGGVLLEVAGSPAGGDGGPRGPVDADPQPHPVPAQRWPAPGGAAARHGRGTPPSQASRAAGLLILTTVLVLLAALVVGGPLPRSASGRDDRPAPPAPSPVAAQDSRGAAAPGVASGAARGAVPDAVPDAVPGAAPRAGSPRGATRRQVAALRPGPAPRAVALHAGAGRTVRAGGAAPAERAVPRGGAGSGSTGRLPGRPGSLHVAVRPAPGDPLALLRVLERLTSARVPGCTTVRLERLVRPYAGAAEWEYTCGAGAARRHAVVRSQRMGTGTVTVRWASPERAWPRDRAHLGSAFDAAVAAAVAAAGEGGSGAGPGTASRAAVRAALAVLSASAPARR